MNTNRHTDRKLNKHHYKTNSLKHTQKKKQIILQTNTQTDGFTENQTNKVAIIQTDSLEIRLTD